MSKSKRILFLVGRDFRDEELFEPLAAVREAGHSTTVCGLEVGTITGMLGGTIPIGRIVPDIDVNDFDVLIMPGGDGTPLLRRDASVLKLVQDFAAGGKLICAICWAPTILAKAGILVGALATCCRIPETDEYPNLRARDVLGLYGAKPSEGHVVCADQVITADGPASASLFAEAIVRKLSASAA